MRSVVGEFRAPIAGHAWIYPHAILARFSSGLNLAAIAHRHARHVHGHVEPDVAHIDGLAVRVTKFEDQLTLTFACFAEDSDG